MTIYVCMYIFIKGVRELIVCCSSCQYVCSAHACLHWVVYRRCRFCFSLFFSFCLSTGAPVPTLFNSRRDKSKNNITSLSTTSMFVCVYSILCRLLILFSFFLSFLFCMYDWFFLLLYFTRLHLYTHLTVHTITGE